jgi:hypothetical protein
MNKIYLYLACLLLSLAAHADKGPRSKTAGKIMVKEGAVKLRFNNLAPVEAHKDSVLIIFDRCDRTGAGVVYSVFSADSARSICIKGVPAGKYYVTIQGLGLHRDRTETIVRVKAQKSQQLFINLEDSEEFSKDSVIIPSSATDLAALSIVNMK